MKSIVLLSSALAAMVPSIGLAAGSYRNVLVALDRGTEWGPAITRLEETLSKSKCFERFWVLSQISQIAPEPDSTRYSHTMKISMYNSDQSKCDEVLGAELKQIEAFGWRTLHVTRKSHPVKREWVIAKGSFVAECHNRPQQFSTGFSIQVEQGPVVANYDPELECPVMQEFLAAVEKSPQRLVGELTAWEYVERRQDSASGKVGWVTHSYERGQGTWLDSGIGAHDIYLEGQTTPIRVD